MEKMRMTRILESTFTVGQLSEQLLCELVTIMLE